MSDIHSNHRQRMREELRKNGLSLKNYPPHKMLEIMLFYAKPRGDTNETAHRLINRFGSLSGVLDAPFDMLVQVDGVGAEMATYIKFMASLFEEYASDKAAPDNKLPDTESIQKYVKIRLAEKIHECIYFLALAKNGKILFSDIVAEGSPDTVVVSPAELVKTALRVNAAASILAHNHPNGISIPSSTDHKTTFILYEELGRVDVELLDHIIVASDGVYSMKAAGMMPRKHGH